MIKMLNNNLVKWIVAILVILHLIIMVNSTYQVANAFGNLQSTIDDIGSGLNPYPEQEELIEEMLIEDNYEVMSVFISYYSSNAPFFEWHNISDDTICAEGEAYCNSDKIGVSVEMKSLGNLNDQLWDVFIVMKAVHPKAFTYSVDILTPTSTCKYLLFGEVADAWFEDKNMEAYNLINEYLNNPALCS